MKALSCLLSVPILMVPAAAWAAPDYSWCVPGPAKTANPGGNATTSAIVTDVCSQISSCCDAVHGRWTAACIQQGSEDAVANGYGDICGVNAWAQAPVSGSQEYYPRDFNLFATTGQVTLKQTVAGAVAAAGAFTMSGESLDYGTEPIALIATGNVNLQNDSIGGSVDYSAGYAARSVSFFDASAPTGPVTSPIHFATANTKLVAMSAALAGYPTNGTITIQHGAVTFTGTDPELNVFSTSASSIANATSYTYSVPFGAHVVVNVSGTSPVVQSAGFSGGTASNILWNFDAATTLSLSSVSFPGSILAPRAAATLTNGQLSGTVVVASAPTAAMAMANAPFQMPSAPDYTPATLLIVTDSTLAPSLASLVAHKNATGMPTELVTVAEFTTRFPAVDTAASVKLGIDFYYRSKGLQYVFLVGDETHVPTRYGAVVPQSAGQNPTQTPPSLQWRPEDLYYADIRTPSGSAGATVYSSWDNNGDGVYNEVAWNYSAYVFNPDQVDGDPEVVVSRLAVSDAASVSNYVTKVIAYETQETLVSTSATFVADYDYGGADGDQDGIAAAFAGITSKSFGEINVPSGTTLTAPWKSFATTDVVTAAASSGWLLYVGHGSQSGWDGIYYNTWDGMTQANMPIVGGAACQTGLFTAYVPDGAPYVAWGTPPPAAQPVPSYVLSNHVLAAAASGGGIAYMGETIIMQDDKSTEFLEDMGTCYSSGQKTLGAVWLCAQQKYWSAEYQYWTNPNMAGDPFREPRVYLLTMTMFGDPSLRLSGGL